VYGTVMTVNLAWPRTAVHPAGGHWYFQRFAILFLLITATAGAVWLRVRSRGEVRPEAVAAESLNAGGGSGKSLASGSSH
jgi:hypothetical protein